MSILVWFMELLIFHGSGFICTLFSKSDDGSVDGLKLELQHNKGIEKRLIKVCPK